LCCALLSFVHMYMNMWTACAAVSSTTVPSLAIDPLITRLLRANGAAAFPPSLDEINAAAEGLTVWRHALAAGRLPDYGGADGGLPPWPPQPLLGTLTDTLSRLSLPRATARHPSLVPAALAAVLAAASEFDARRVAAVTGESADDDTERAAAEREGEAAEAEAAEAEEAEEQLQLEAARQIALSVESEWSSPLRGVRAVEGLGGGSGGDVGALTAAPGDSFSLADGLWRHSGWSALEGVQAKLRELDELSELVASLGQRAAPEGTPTRGPAVSFDPQAAPSAALGSFLEPARTFPGPFSRPRPLPR
jgi:hypothetical protein